MFLEKLRALQAGLVVTQGSGGGSLEADLEKKTPVKMTEAKKEYNIKQSSKKGHFP